MITAPGVPQPEQEKPPEATQPLEPAAPPEPAQEPAPQVQRDEPLSVFDQIDRERQEAARRERGMSAHIIDRALELPPARAARVLDLGSQTGYDLDLVNDNLDDMEKRAAEEGFDSEKFSQSPKMLEWLKKSKYHLSVGRADVDNLARLEHQFRRRDDTTRPASDYEAITEEAARAKRHAPQHYAAQPSKLPPQFDMTGLGFLEFGERSVNQIEGDLRKKYIENRQAVERYIAGRGEVGFFESAEKRFKENPLWWMGGGSGVLDLSNAKDLWDAANAAKPDEDQRYLLRQYQRVSEAAERRGTRIDGHIAEILMALPGIVTEFSLTAGSFTATKEAVQQVLTGAAKKGAAGFAARAAGTVVASGRQTLEIGVPRAATNAIGRMMPQVKLSATDEGEIDASVVEGTGEQAFSAFTKGALREFSQTFSERLGGGVEGAIRSFRKATAVKWLQLHPERGVSGFMKKLREMGGWNGPLGEWSEERYAELMEIPIEGKWQVASVKQQAAELLAFTLPSTPGMARAAYKSLTAKPLSPQEQAQIAKDKDILDQIGKAVSDTKMPEEQKESYIKSVVAGTRSEFVYASASRFNEYWEGKKDAAGNPTTAEAEAVKLGLTAEEYRAAVANGERLKIPTEKYATKVAPTEHNGFFQDELSLSPDTVGHAEAKIQLEEHEKDAVEAEAISKISEERINKMALAVAKVEAKRELEELKKSDFIAKADEKATTYGMGPKLYIPGKSATSSASELSALGFPDSMIATAGDTVGRVVIEEVAQKNDMSRDEFLSAVAQAAARRAEAASGTKVVDAEAEVKDAVFDEQFQKAVAVHSKRAIARKAKVSARAAVKAEQQKKDSEEIAAFLSSDIEGKVKAQEEIEKRKAEADALRAKEEVEEAAEQEREEIEAEEELAKAAVRAKETKAINEAARQFSDGLKRGLQEAGFKRDSTNIAVLANAAFRRAAKRGGLEAVRKLFGNYNLKIRKFTDATRADIMKSLEQAAYHGSPYVYDKVDLSHAGSGQGAWAYGWGYYVAENKAVAEKYKVDLTHAAALRDMTYDGELVATQFEPGTASAIQQSLLVKELKWAAQSIPRGVGVTRETVAEALERGKQYMTPESLAAVRSFDKSKLSGIPEGRLYHLEIPDEGYLDFDAATDEQDQVVMDALRSLGFDPYGDVDSTGKSAYNWLVMKRTQARLKAGETPDVARNLAKIDASKDLSALGVVGNKYLDGGSRGGHGGTSNFVVFDAKNVQIEGYSQDGESEGKEPLGSLTFGDLGELSINLFRKADKSTPLHELGHFFLEMMIDVSKLDTADQGIKDDVAGIFKWMGVKPEDWAKWSINEKRKYHEKWATSFERYLMTGEAPSERLQSAFHHFKEWLTEVYKDIKKLARLLSAEPDVSPELKGIFDRMLASEKEIEDVQEHEQMRPMFESGLDAGMTPAEARRYADDGEKLSEQAKANLGAKLMRSTQQEDTQWWKDERDRIKAEVEEKVNATPVYKALAAFRENKIKLSREQLSKAFPGEGGKGVNEKIPSYAYLKEENGGEDVALVADVFGFKSAEEFVHALMEAPPKRELIAESARWQMLMENGTEPTVEERNDLGKEIVASGGYEGLIEMEMMALSRLAAGALRNVGGFMARPPSMSIIRDRANRAVAKMPTGKLAPRAYMTAAKQNQLEAIRLWKKGDFPGALEAKKKQAFNIAYFNAITKAKENVDEARAGYKRFNKSNLKLASGHDMVFVNAARTILAKMNVGKKDKPADSYLDDTAEHNPEAFRMVNAIVQGAISGDRPIEEMSYEDWYVANEAVQALWKLSIESGKSLIDGKKIDREEIVRTLTKRLEERKPLEAEEGVSSTDETTVTSNVMTGVEAYFARMESWVERMDAGDSGKPFRHMIWNPISEAVNQAKELRNEKFEELDKILDPIRDSFVKGEIVAKPGELGNGEKGRRGFKFKNFSQLMGALTHIGNLSNLRKLIVGNGWAEVNDDGSYDRSGWDRFFARMQEEGVIKKEHMDAIQKIWNLTDSMKAGIWKAHNEITGTYPDAVTKHPVETKWGTLEGGYVPAIPDPSQSSDAAIKAAMREIDDNTPSLALPTVGSGSTKTRSETFAKPLIMDIGRLGGHIWWAARYTHLEPRVREVARIFRDKGFAAQINARSPGLVEGFLMPWLQRAASQTVETPMVGWPKVAAAFRFIRKRTGLTLMTGNVVNAVQNYTGLGLAALRIKGSFLAEGIRMSTMSPGETTELIASKSLFMKNLTYNEMVGMADDIHEILENPNVYQKAVKWTERHGMFLQKITQNHVSRAVWLGAYNQAVAEKQSEIEAVRHADSVVRMTQGSGSAEDVSKMETGTAFIRLFTQFSSYFNMWANLMGTEYTKAMQGEGLTDRGARVAFIYLAGALGPMIGTYALMSLAKGGVGDDENKNGKWDEALGGLALEHLKTVAAMVPGAGQAVRTLSGEQDRLTVAPALSVLEQGLKALPGAYKYATRDRGSRMEAAKVTRDTITALSLATGLPVDFLKRGLTYAADVADRKAKPEGAVDAVRGVLSGSRGNPK